MRMTDKDTPHQQHAWSHSKHKNTHHEQPGHDAREKRALRQWPTFQPSGLKENGVFVMEVEFFEREAAVPKEQDFTR